MQESFRENGILTSGVQVFLSLCETHSFSKTAKLLGYSQPAVSHQLQDLETRLGVTLFDRKKRPAQLTTEGRIFQEAISPLLSSLPEVISTLRSKANLRPPLRIGFIESLSMDVAPLLLERLKPYTGKQLCLTGTCDRLLEKLKNGELDILVSSDPFESTFGLRRKFIFSEPSVILLPRSYFESHKKERFSWDDLRFSGLPYIRYYRESGGGKLSDALLSALKLNLVGTVEVDTNGLMLSLVARGIGWTLSRTTSLLQHHYLVGNIVVSPMPPPQMGRAIFLIDYPNNVPVSLHNLVFSTIVKIVKTDMRQRLINLAPWIEDGIFVSE